MSGGEVWARFAADPRDPAAADLRAADSDRDVVLDVLRDAFADGRLTRAEYDDRVDAGLNIRVLGGVAPVIGDLVLQAGTSRRRATGDLHDQAVTKYRRDLRDARNGWLFVSGTTVAVWGATSVAGGGAYFFWPIFPVIGVGIGWFSMRLNAESRIEDTEEKLVEKARRRGQIGK